MTDKKAILKKQSLNNFPKAITDIFHLLSISGNYFLIGSANYKNFLYSADFDLNEIYKSKDTKTVLNNLYNNFKDKFIEAKKDPNIFITDFKCGEDNKKEPLRWSYEDMMKGYKIQRKHKYDFRECLLMKATMKLDIIAFVNGIATEITDNYFLNIGTKHNSNNDGKKDVVKKLIESYNELVSEKQYFKAIKRLFSIQVLENKPSKKLLDLFNSDLGRLYKSIADINIIVELFEQTFKTVPIDKIINNLQVIKYSMSKITSVNINFVTTEIDNICKLSKDQIKNKLINLADKLQIILNNQVKNYLVKI